MLALRPMTEAGFAAYIERQIPEYAAEKVLSGSWAQEGSIERSRADFAKFLPEGLASKGQALFDVVDNGTGACVGHLWLDIGGGRQPGVAFIYHIVIDESHRGRGLGKAALGLAEAEARRHGLAEMQLHVFGFNSTAIALYTKAGYAVVDMVMRKPL